MVNKALPLSKTTARVHVQILGVANALPVFDLQRSLRARGGRALEPDLDAAAGEHVKDVSSQFRTPGAHTDQVPFTASPIEERTEDKAGNTSSSADVHGSEARRDGQRGASDPKTMGGHVSEGWNNNNPLVALSPRPWGGQSRQNREATQPGWIKGQRKTSASGRCLPIHLRLVRKRRRSGNPMQVRMPCGEDFGWRH